MTSRSRRKLRIILRLVLTTTAALSPAVVADEDNPEAAARLASREKAAERIKQAPALRVGSPTSTRSSLPLDVDRSQTSLQINIEPPNRQQLFKLETTTAIVETKQAELAKSIPLHDLPIPGPTDHFTLRDSERLGRLWNEAVIVRTSHYDRTVFGTMGVVERTGRYPFKAGTKPPTSAAVMNEFLPASDMEVGVEVLDLGALGNEFGVVVRAKSPEIELPQDVKPNDVYYYVNTGDFYTATMGADRVELRRIEKGKPTIIKSASLPPKTSFRITVRALGNSFRVYRDAEEVLSAEDGAFVGHYAGVIGVRADLGQVRFDNYEARSYAGEFLPRMWTQWTRLYHGPNVHYNTLYFEQRALERHGQHLGNPFQPFIAHSLFFLDVALLPMSVGRSAPGDCYASELYARPGDLVPFYISCPQPTAKGLLFEAAAWTPILILAP